MRRTWLRGRAAAHGRGQGLTEVLWLQERTRTCRFEAKTGCLLSSRPRAYLRWTPRAICGQARMALMKSVRHFVCTREDAIIILPPKKRVPRKMVISRLELVNKAFL